MKIIYIATLDVVTEEFSIQPVVAKRTIDAKRIVADAVCNDVIIGYAGSNKAGLFEKEAISWSVIVPGVGLRNVMNVKEVLK